MTPIRPMRIISRRTSYIPHALAIALLWALAMTLDYHDKAGHAEARSAEMSAQMAACLRGEWRGRTESGEQIGCMPAVTHNTQSKG